MTGFYMKCNTRLNWAKINVPIIRQKPDKLTSFYVMEVMVLYEPTKKFKCIFL